MFVLGFPLIPSGDGLRSESPSGSALLAETLALAAAVLMVPSNKPDLFLLSEGPRGQARVPPAALLGEEVPPGWNQTPNPEGGPAVGQSKAHVRQI